MCKQCETKPVYEFTNKRTICKTCYIRYFQKKFLYIVRKFKLIGKNDVVGYKSGKGFRDVVLEDVLKMFAEKAMVELIKVKDSKLYPQVRDIDNKQLIENFYINSFNKLWTRRSKLKIAITSTIDLIALEIINTLIKSNLKKLKLKPVEGKIIRPLYLFLDKEIELYAKLKNLKFNNVKLQKTFLDDFEKKHPEIKHAIVNGYLQISTYVTEEN